MTYLLPGDYGVTTISNNTGRLIRLGERLLDGRDHAAHAFLVLDQGCILEAQPGGSVIRQVTEWPSAVYYRPPLSNIQRLKVPAVAHGLTGIPYGWLDYASLVLMKFHVRPSFVVRRVNDGSHAICSQLVDMAELRLGFHLFDDGRKPGDVTPGDLAAIGDKKGWRIE
jgi:hypothetical protein